MKNYTLNNPATQNKTDSLEALRRLLPLLATEKWELVIAGLSVLINAVTSLLTPIIIGYAVDHYITKGSMSGLLGASAVLCLVALAGFVASYHQTIRMGGVGRRVLYKLRDELFAKIQDLPVVFFNQNKIGDLISRINNDTDKMSQFFSQVLMQFTRNFFLIIGAACFLIAFHPKLGIAALVPALCVLVLTQLLTPWVKKRNRQSLQTGGEMSAEIQESLENFKVMYAFNRLDYFRSKFEAVNQSNWLASKQAGFANGIFMPLHTFASFVAMCVVFGYGITLISEGQITPGLLIGFLLYVEDFYTPLRQLASIWSTIQQSLAALDRIQELLALKSDLVVMPQDQTSPISSANTLLEFEHVSFRYVDGKEVLKRVSFSLQQGKTYAFVGPTGGGKTTTASLMARLFDPTEGVVRLKGKDIRTYSHTERSTVIGFVLQEPFLFTGTLLDNLFYGHPTMHAASQEARQSALEAEGFEQLLAHFKEGVHTPIRVGSDGLSLGQRQLVAFMRAVLRKPNVFILDEATANIDTLTEQALDAVLQKLPQATTKIIIAHRLNTIAIADEIFFVNAGTVTPAGSLNHAIELLMHGKRTT